MKQLIAKMEQGIQAGRLLVWKAGWKKNLGERNTRETSLAKWFCTDHAVAAALVDAGVTRLFGVPGGGSSLDLIAAARRRGLPFALARHETAAVIMAAISSLRKRCSRRVPKRSSASVRIV